MVNYCTLQMQSGTKDTWLVAITDIGHKKYMCQLLNPPPLEVIFLCISLHLYLIHLGTFGSHLDSFSELSYPDDINDKIFYALLLSENFQQQRIVVSLATAMAMTRDHC